MNNREVAHLWANQSRQSARGGSHFYFEGDTLYSYGYHFPVARIFAHPVTGERCALFNSRTYSRTTSKHQGYARSAASHLKVYFTANVNARVSDLADLQRIEADETARKAASELQAKEERREKARMRRQRAKQAEEIRAAYSAELEAWRAGGPEPRLWRMERRGVFLRLCDGGKRIETSQGAKVPAIIARKAWPVLSAAVAKETASPSAQAWVPFFEQPEWNWGDYRGIALRRVALGSPVELVVGCHQIPWAELERMAQTLGLTPVPAAS